jgi:hypothetical protein
MFLGKVTQLELKFGQIESAFEPVTAGLGPAFRMDPRDKPGDDDGEMACITS